MNPPKGKFALVEVWIGKIPDYFNFHLHSAQNVKTIDFFFFTNDFDFKPVNLPKNYHVLYITIDEFVNRFNQVSRVKIDRIDNYKKITDFKLLYFEMFKEYISDYQYYGCYDIDTLFGNIDTVLSKIQDYDFITIGNKKYHNRLSGPLLIMKNEKSILDLIQTDRFYETLLLDEIYGYGEKELSVEAFKNFKVYMIEQTNISEESGKNEFEVLWSSGSLFFQDKEIYLFHFYKKDFTRLRIVGDMITTFCDKKLVDDFYWVVHFTENYEKFLPSLIQSIKKYSNRKCIFYSINYFSKIAFETQFFSDQFLFKYIEVPKGKLDYRGRDFNILTSKPKILLDAIESFDDKKFVHIDTDIFFTTNSDDISKYIPQLENYPLANSHIHDVIFVNNIIPNEEWTSSLHVLLKEEKIERDPVYPRRKCNVILFDKKSHWFFKEQMDIYQKYSESTVPGILQLHDEDTFNAILAKYDLVKSLPLIDIEETHNLSLEKLNNYSYNMTSWVSPNVVLPSSINDFLFFHGFKETSDYEKIKNFYGNDVLDFDDILVTYKNQTVFFEKNSFLRSKEKINIVDFILKDKDNNEIIKLSNQQIKKYWFFYVSNIYLGVGVYKVEIYNKENGQKIYNNLIEIK
jgi:hypothetical protein